MFVVYVRSELYKRKLTQKEIEIVMNALCGTPTLTSAEFANKIERILKKYL